MIQLRQRMDVLPGHIWATRGRAPRERIAVHEREIAQSKTSMPQLSAAMQAAEEGLKDATEKRTAVRAEMWAIQGQARSAEMDLRAAERELSVHLNSVDKPGNPAGRAMVLGGSR